MKFALELRIGGRLPVQIVQLIKRVDKSFGNVTTAKLAVLARRIRS